MVDGGGWMLKAWIVRRGEIGFNLCSGWPRCLKGRGAAGRSIDRPRMQQSHSVSPNPKPGLNFHHDVNANKHHDVISRQTSSHTFRCARPSVCTMDRLIDRVIAIDRLGQILLRQLQIFELHQPRATSASPSSLTLTPGAPPVANDPRGYSFRAA